MVLRLDPARPLVWRTPFSLQLGVEPPVIVLEELSPTDEVVVELLRSGVTRAMLADAVRSNGWSGPRVDQLLRLLAPALGGPATAPLEGVDVAIEGDPRDATPLGSLLTSLGAEVTTAGDGDDDSRDARSRRDARDDGRRRVAVVLSHHVVAPRAASRWLRADVPHLLVRFGDRSIRVGPFVDPGAGPCATCIELRHTDLDPAWPALAAQLSRRRAASADAYGRALLAPVVARVLSASGDEGWSTRVLRLPRLGGRPWPGGDDDGGATALPGDGVEEIGPVTPHPRCGCQSPRGSATAPAPPSAAIRPPPTTAPGAPRRA